MAKGKSKAPGKGRKPPRKKAAAKAKKPVRKPMSGKSAGSGAAPKPAAKRKVAAPKPVARPVLRRPVKDRASVARMPSARPASQAGVHRAPALTANIYERDLDKTPANYAPLTPLQF